MTLIAEAPVELTPDIADRPLRASTPLAPDTTFAMPLSSRVTPIATMPEAARRHGAADPLHSASWFEDLSDGAEWREVAAQLREERRAAAVAETRLPAQEPTYGPRVAPVVRRKPPPVWVVAAFAASFAILAFSAVMATFVGVVAAVALLA